MTAGTFTIAYRWWSEAQDRWTDRSVTGSAEELAPYAEELAAEYGVSDIRVTAHGVRLPAWRLIDRDLIDLFDLPEPMKTPAIEKIAEDRYALVESVDEDAGGAVTVHTDSGSFTLPRGYEFEWHANIRRARDRDVRPGGPLPGEPVPKTD